ncbi:MAG: hypothetical protein R3F05_03360 [Planctomycetota bacterium]
MATDSVGQTATRKFQWKIDTPPMIVGTVSIAGGVAGEGYADTVQIVDGVPPFKFELTADLPTDLDNTSSAWSYAPPAAPTFPSVSGFTVADTGSATNKLSAADYPSPAAVGPYYPAPPEGLYLNEEGGLAGSFAGIPRRHGSFTINVHAFSSTVPNERGQHAFTQLSFDVAPGAPLEMVDSFVVDGDGSNTFLATTQDGVATLPEFEVQQPQTVQMVAQGGVAFDGYTDAPHSSQRALDLGEVAGTYDWSISSWDSRGEGWHPANSPAGRPTGIDADITGQLFTTNGGTDLERQGRQIIEVTVSDRRLPTPQVDAHEMALSVGPDVLIITESRQSSTTTTGSQYDPTVHNDGLFVKKMLIINNAAQKSPLDDTDLVANHTIPAAANLGALSNPLGRLISGVGKATYTGTGRDAGANDLMRVVVNATGWWNDSFNLHPKGARAFQHADAGKSSYEYHANEYYCYSANPETTAVALPDIVDGSVVHAPASGIYADGGKLYTFENNTHFGVFVIREDGKVYVPIAMQKGSWTGFGDYCQAPLQGTGAGASTASHMRMVHMAVSPNGRFAAMKIMANPTNQYESPSQTRVVVFDLSGEKPFGGETWRMVGTAVTSGYVRADALALTDAHLYMLVQRSSLNYRYSWQQHNVMREDILGGTGTAMFAPGLPSNAASSYLSVPYHNTPTSYISSSWNGTTVYANYYLYMGGCSTNRLEDEAAPIPFRVSADGSTCALLAGAYTGATTGSSVFEFHAWVDKNGAGFVQASTTDRKAPFGGARAHRVRFGTVYYGYAGLAQWGKHEGPSGGLELSDDGSKLAYTVSEASSVNSGTYYSTYQVHYNTEWRLNRMNVVSIESNDNWATRTERLVTASTFGGAHRWRFGGLSFSRDGNRLYFFGGISLKDALGTNDTYSWSTSVYNGSAFVNGTYYQFDYTNPVQVRSVLPTSAGGPGANSYTASSPFNPTSGSLSTAWGNVTPMGGFWSQDGSFLYVVAGHPIQSSNNTCNRLVGINTTGSDINGHPAGAGFAVANWPSTRGFFDAYSNAGCYYGAMICYRGVGVHHLARIKMAPDTGVVFWASHSSRYSTTASTSYGSAFSIGYHSTYAKDAGHIECFSSNVGGAVQRVTTFTNDGTLSSPRGRGIHFIDVTDSGDRLAFIYDIGNTGGTTEYLCYQNHEGVGYVGGIELDPFTGTLTGRTMTLLEGNEGSASGQVGTAVGRAGSSLAFGTDGQRVYYSFGPGASDENQRKIVGPRIDGAGSVDGGTSVRHGTGARESVLHAGR